MQNPNNPRASRDPVIEVETFAAPPRARASALDGLTPARIGFLLVVIVPTLVVALWLSLFSSPRFESTTQFVVRSQEGQSLGGLSSLVQSVAATTSYENAYAVIAYIRSHDALGELDTAVGYEKMVSDGSVDIVSRWSPGLFGTAGRDGLLRYYNRMVEATIDTRSGIVELTVTAFQPKDAERIAQALMGSAEALVNRMNEREHAARLADAAREVSRAEQNLLGIDLQVQKARIATGIIDPKLETSTGTSTVLGLQQALAAKRAGYQALMDGNPRSPLLPRMAREVTAMEEEIARTRAGLAGSQDSLVEKITEFEQLNLEKEFATEALLSARRTLETSRMDASRKTLFLATVSRPNLPDTPLQFRALQSTLTVFAALFLTYSILWLLLVNVREHKV